MIRRKLRNREDSFILQLTKMGIRHELFRADDFDPASVSTKGSFDLCIIGGEPCYQSISVGARVRKAGFLGSMLFEITEEDASNEIVLGVAQNTARRYGMEDHLANFVYLTRARKSPLSIDFATPLIANARVRKKSSQRRPKVNLSNDGQPTTTDTLDKVRRASDLGYTKEASIVDRLLRAGWLTQRELISSYERLEHGGHNTAIVLHQLPYRVDLPDQWFSIPTEVGEVQICFRVTGANGNEVDPDLDFATFARTNYEDVEQFHNACLPNDPYGTLCRTQVLLVFEVWGRRARWYPKYLASLRIPNRESFKKAHIVPGSESWLGDSRPLTPQTFEADLARRLFHAALKICKTVVPEYAIACQDPYAHEVERLTNAVLMVKGGRVVVTGPGESLLAQYVQPYQFKDFSRNLDALMRRIEAKRPIAIYERYLLEAIRQIHSGVPNLAVVQAVMILDWFANEVIEDRIIKPLFAALGDMKPVADIVSNRVWENAGQKDTKIKVNTMEKFREYFPAAGITLSAPLLQRLQKAYELRNAIVHRIHIKAVSNEAAFDAVGTALEVIRSSISSLVLSAR